MDRPDVSFVVIAYNEASGIRRTLLAILDQLRTGSLEVVVVDDGSTDGTPSIVSALAAEHPEVRLLALDTNHGRGHARHAGITAARAPLIATVDADIVLPPDWLATCLESLDGADAVGGTAVPDGDVAYIARVFDLVARPVAHTTTLTGSNALYRGDLFQSLSFDPSLREGEDIAFNHLLEGSTARFFNIPGLLVAHEEHKTLGESLAWMVQSGRGAARQLYRYRELRGPDLAFGGFLVTTSLDAARSPRRPYLTTALVVAAAAAHVARGFDVRSTAPAETAKAVAVDAAMLVGYFAGRLLGTVEYALRQRNQAAAPAAATGATTSGMIASPSSASSSACSPALRSTL